MPNMNSAVSFGGLKTDLPLALFPVRLETRFNAEGTHLLVRIYPDAIHADSFEPELTPVEITWGKHFWEQTWLAGRNEARERSAWAQLAEQFGSTRAAWIAKQLSPTNPENQPTAPLSDEGLSVQPVFPDPKQHIESWTRASYTQILPDHWVAIGYHSGEQVFTYEGKTILQPLALSPSPEKGLNAETLKDDPEFGWIVDFSKAEDIGMGLRIPYSQVSLDRLLVVGVNAGLSSEKGQKRLEELLTAHHYTQGLGFIPQGTPSNNTDDAPSGYSTLDSGFEDSFRLERQSVALTEHSNGIETAKALGIAEDVFHNVREAATREQLDIYQMNVALWPSTWGYFLEQMMAGDSSLSDDMIRYGREHFERFVRGRGPLPAIRIANQPYGLLPVISLDHWKAQEAETMDVALEKFLSKLREVWRRSLPNVPRVPGNFADPETLLKVIAMTPISVDYAMRRAQRTVRILAPSSPDAKNSGSVTSKRLVEEMGLFWMPEQIRMVFESYARVSSWDGGLVNPHSGVNSAEYINDLTSKTFDEILSWEFKVNSTSIFFWLLRESCLREYLTSAYSILHSRGLVTLDERLDKKWDDHENTIPWSLLDREVNDLNPRRIGDYLHQVKIQLSDQNFNLQNILITGAQIPGDVQEDLGNFVAFFKSLNYLAKQPEAKLEGLLRETLDLCSHRYDAWVTSLATKRLKSIRQQRPQGIYIGGYGWVENLKKVDRQKVNPATVGGSNSVYVSEGNQGFVHAPSLAHATTAALLRSGYLSRRSAGDQNAFAINLTSERVRLALWLLDGVRQGQSLSALLGYRFERGLHKNYPNLVLDQYIPSFRRIAALNIETPTSGTEQQQWIDVLESLPANKVVDGLALLSKYQAKEGSAQSIPWGLGGLPGEDSDLHKTHKNACISELNRLANAVDAISDLVIAESVHQVAQGNHVRAGSTLTAIAEGEAPPPDLEVISTPRTGIAITHRIVVVVAESQTPAAWGNQSVRAQAEPFLNAWVASLLGESAVNAVCRVEYLDRTSGKVLTPDEPTEVSFTTLGLAPLDLVYLPESDGAVQQSEIEQRVIYEALRSRPAEIPENVDIRLTFSRDASWPKSKLSFAEVLETSRMLRRLITAARALEARDLALPGKQISPDFFSDDSTLAFSARAKTAIDSFKQSLENLNTALKPEIINSEDVRGRLMSLAAFGLPGAVPKSSFGDTPEAQVTLRVQAESISAQASERVKRINVMESDFNRIAKPDTAVIRDYHLTCLHELFGVEFRVLPRFVAVNPADLNLTPQASIALQGNPQEVVTWFQRVARVREGAARLDAALLYTEALSGDGLNLNAQDIMTVRQLPYNPNDRWAALQGEVSGSRVSLVLQASSGIDYSKPIAGLLIDEWVEVIPSKQETTGLAFHFDAPQSRAPQSILFAMPPGGRSEWDLETLEATVLETLELAKLRCVDLTALDELGQFLPALYFPHSRAPQQ